MADRWYYSHDNDKKGPFSDRELRDQADAGKILPTDTIWKQGVEKGVEASNVKNLFPPAEEVCPQAEADMPIPKVDGASQPPISDVSFEDDSGASVPDTQAQPEQKTPVPPYQPTVQPKQIATKRAVAGKGVIIAGQDGTSVRIRKKCTVCGHEDSSRQMVRIKNGVNRLTFYCRNCRKVRQVDFKGFSH